MWRISYLLFEPFPPFFYTLRCMSDFDRKIPIRKLGPPQKDLQQNVLEVDLQFSLGREWLDLFRKWNEVVLQCARCNKIYNDIENIGAWNCRQHARDHNGSSSGRFYGPYRWDCCGQIYNENPRNYVSGCIPCDHRPKNENYISPVNDLIIPIVFVPQLRNFNEKSILRGTELEEFKYQSGKSLDPQTWAVISRFSHLEHSSRFERGTDSSGDQKMAGGWRSRKDMSFYGLG